MKEFAINLKRMRKEKQMTQKQLAQALGISPQAVSKWERGECETEMDMTARIAGIFNVDVNFLLGYSNDHGTHYEEKYRRKGFYWGYKVNDLAYEVLKLMPPTRPLRLLDIGCGEGQAAVFFARNGYQVSAFDIAETGIQKGRKLAEAAGVHVDFLCADMLSHELEGTYDIIYSTDVLEYVPQEDRERVLLQLKEHTETDGINVLDVFVEKPFIETAPDWEHGKEHYWKTGELFSHYHDWKIELLMEPVFDCMSAGIYHRHCMDKMIARKMG